MISDYEEISHLISLHAKQQTAGFVPFAIGHVIAYDPSTHSVQLALPGFPVVDPVSGNATGGYSLSPWVQLGSPWVGNGWGFQTAPEVGSSESPFSGTQCALVIEQRVSSMGVAGYLLYNSNALPPDKTLVAGEAILKHKSGTNIKFHSDGSLTVISSSGSEIDMEASGEISVTVPNGQVFAVNGTNDALALVSHLVTAFNSHTHGGVTTGGGTSGTPSSPWSASTIESSIVKVAS